MGEIYRAEDLRLGLTVALKFLPESVARVPAAWAHVEREVRVARQISHPNVCRVFDIGEGEDGPFIAMEFIDGEDLASLLKRIGRLPPDKGLQVAHQICTGLAAAHELGIVHRDLKPANIMLDGRGRVRITDFGLAALVEELRKDSLRGGTPAYMAPEQAAGGPVTPRTDVYAAGLVLYELFSGRQAFSSSLSAAQRRSTPLKLSKVAKGLDPAIERIVSRCLEPSPEARPASAAEIAAALPGGDPLRAAVEAGETPSPDTVAAAGESVTMSMAVSVGLLAVVLAGIAFSAFIARYSSLLDAVRGGKPPEALAERAREVITRFGYDENAADSAWWLQPNRAELAQLGRGSPESMHFVYRQSPRPMIPRNLFSITESDDPPANTPGEIRVVLDSRGRLREFLAVPLGGDTGEAKPPDWHGMLAEAGTTAAQPAPENPAVIPLVAFDQRQDWKTREDGQNLSLTLAGYKGKPVYFRAALAASRPAAGQQTDSLAGIMFVVAVVVCGIGGCLLARRNMRRGRGDRQGAFRVAAFIFSGEIVGWLFSAHYYRAAGEEYVAFIGGCGEALYVAGFMWVLYMAIEPYVRRRWPEMLISWARVLSTNFYDSRVGRDVMLGALGGTTMAAIQNSVDALPAWFRVANILPVTPALLPLRGPAGMIAILGAHASQAVQWALATISFLVVARFITRRDWLAVIVSAVSLGLVVLAANNLALAVPAAMLCAAIIYSLLFRFGLLSVAAALFFYFVLRRWPITLDLSQWFVWRSVFAMALLVAIAIYAWLAINAGRSFFADAEDEM